MLSRTSRILLVVAALAAVVYLWLGRSKTPGAGDTAERLAAFDPARVDGVVLQRGDETLRFAREDSLWRMTAPVDDSAERDAVMSLLDALARAQVARNLGETDDLAPFGLDPPLVHITLLAGADTLLGASIGKRTVDEAWCYAHTGSREVLLVPTDIARAASHPVDAYRDHRVIDFQLRDVWAYRFETAGETMTWFRRPGGWYTVEHGDTVTGDSVAVESVLRRLRGLRAASFVDEQYNDHTPREASIELWWASDMVSRIELWRAPGGVWRAASPGRYQPVIIEDDMSDLLQHTTTSLRDRRLLQFSPPDAARIDVALPGAEGSIVRRGGAWSYPNPALGRVDPDRAADFVRALRALKWTDLPPKGAPGDLRAGRFFVTVTREGGTILDEMRADRRDDGLWYVTSRSSRGVWMIESTELAALADRFAQLKAR